MRRAGLRCSRRCLEKKVTLLDRAVVVAQLVERSLLIPAVRGSNPVIGEINIEHLFTVNFVPKCLVFSKAHQSALSNVTRLGNLLDFGQLFKAFGSNSFVQISHILRQFL